MAKYSGAQAVRRYVVLVIGLAIMSCGIAMSKLAELGTTPISCIPATLSYSSFTIGIWTMIFNAILVLAQLLILRKEFQLFQLLQLIIAFLIGAFTDVWVALLEPYMAPDSYIIQWAYCILAAVILGFGIMLEIKADVLMAPGEGFILAVSRRTGIPFPRTKVISDTSMVITGAVLSILINGELLGVREGTIFAAISVGFIVGMYRRYLGPMVDRMLE